MPSAKVCLSIVLLAACGGGARPAPAKPAPAMPTAAAPATVTTKPEAAPKPELGGPVHERAKQLRRAGDLLDSAQQALDLGNRNNADVLFSTAELLVGPEALAALAPRFREGAPPRVTSPIEQVALDQPAQPEAVGNSDDDEAAEAAEAKVAPKPARGSLSGTLTIAGQTGGGLALVTLEPKGRTWKPRAPRQRVMEQRERQFAPKLMLVPTGSTVTFPNFDAIFHNVFSTSQPGAFDLGLYRQGETRAVTFAKEGIVRLGCNIHSNMSATIVVIGAPHYVIPGGDGAFAFRSLAPGTYTLRAWSDRSRTPITQEVTIRAGVNSVAIGVDGDAPPGVLDDKFGAARGK